MIQSPQCVIHTFNTSQVCGNPGFSTEIRDMVLNSMNEYDLLEFAEVEFRPDGVRQGFPGIRSPDQEGLEMDRISPSMQVARIKDIERLTKPSKSRLSTSYKTRSDENNELARIEFSSVELERGLTYTESKGKKVEEKEFV